MAHRYFTEDITEKTARIAGEDAAHLARVLRAKPGMKVTLCNGAGTDYEAEILAATPQEVTLRVLSSRATAAEPTICVDAFIGYAKGERMDWAVQKAVELGAASVQPFYSENTVVKPGKDDAKKTARLARIAAEAAKQSGRGVLPQVHMPLSFAQILPLAAQRECALFLYEKGGAPLRSVIARQKSFAIITGAEGGFTPGEAAQAKQAGCVAVGLGPRILRCETAPAAVLAVVMSQTGNLE